MTDVLNKIKAAAREAFRVRTSAEEWTWMLNVDAVAKGVVRAVAEEDAKVAEEWAEEDGPLDSPGSCDDYSYGMDYAADRTARGIARAIQAKWGLEAKR